MIIKYNLTKTIQAKMKFGQHVACTDKWNEFTHSFDRGNLKERDKSEDPGTDGGITFNCI
jgi:hypothetical protein